MNGQIPKSLSSEESKTSPETTNGVVSKPHFAIQPCQPAIKSIKLNGRADKSPVKCRTHPKVQLPGIIKSVITPKFIYGNYSRYYGYRNLKDFHDIRLDVFAEHKELFVNKEILDIGCNCGLVSMEVAKNMNVKHMTGIDIDAQIIANANKFLGRAKNEQGVSNGHSGFPYNVTFVHGNYVLGADVLLELEEARFDVVMCLSVTKWIHLNYGDSGLKQAFRRMYAQLREGGILILEPQPWNSYKRRKKLTPEIFQNYEAIKFKPDNFTEYLISNEVGFKTVNLLAVPEHESRGFQRPIQVFSK